MVVIPAHIFYMSIVYSLQYVFNFKMFLTGPFIGMFFLTVVVQLLILLYLAYVSVFGAWKWRINPDNSAIPFTSALADVSGNFLMAAAFLFLDAIGDRNALPDIESYDVMSNTTSLTTMATNVMATLIDTVSTNSTA